MIPKLIHPQKIIIQNVLPGTVNNVFQEPENELTYDTPFAIMAQVKFYDYKKMDFSVSGYELKGNGYLLVNINDAKIILPKAKISSIADNSVEYYVSDMTPTAAYAAFHFMKIFFKSQDLSST